ncbi:hypothetical protein SAMN04487857_104335 [Pseudomonas sp. ok272]|uniref:hypothetical protein n=1 Tax=unclassified Pseudomonas TaxID=196821 RepID=UPI0008B03F9C|nr:MULTISPECIES: hypothetical protein [unclassified Pseudomonas]SEM74297.1 hypothetical protein SAMN04487857_104335 [Pseudomonas sp. ok272]SFM63049.1 hypothetical protein SAMN04487858_104335 [Pseudomonas sp. ok602]
MANLKDVDAGRAAMSAVRLAKSKLRATAPVLDGLLDDVEGDDINMLPKDRWGVDNNVTIEEVLEISPPPPPGRPVVLQLLWGGNLVGTPLTVTTPVDTSQVLVLPANTTVSEGFFPLSYRLSYAGNPTDYAPPVLIRIDKEAPNRNSPGELITLPAEYADGRITKERLDANPIITLTIPLHPDRRTGDTADVYMGASSPGMFIGRYTAPDSSTSEMTVELTKAQVENGREGDRIIYYVLTDRTGNVGPNSKELDVKVELTAAPSNLKPLEVPEAPDPENLITIKDAYPDVGVVINEYDSVGSLDEIALLWDGIPQARKFARDGFPVIFDVSYEHVKRNGLGPRAVSVSYSVWRGLQEYPETTPVPVNVDLRRPGTLPPDPENPEIGNPNLAPVTVQAAKTTDPNKFELIDAGEDGTASTIIDDVRDDGDVYQLYWGGVPVPGGQYIVDGSESDGDSIEFNIPGDFITEQGNNPAVPVHYTITNPALPDNNENPSLRQPVSVYVVRVTLPTPKILHTENFGGVDFVTCKSLRSIPIVGWAAVVEVPGGGPLIPGMVLAFTWSGVTHDADGNPVEVPDFTFNRPLVGNEHVDGFTVYLPHDAALLPIRDGSGKIAYMTLVGGRPESSVEQEVQVVVRDGDNNNCPLR